MKQNSFITFYDLAYIAFWESSLSRNAICIKLHGWAIQEDVIDYKGNAPTNGNRQMALTKRLVEHKVIDTNNNLLMNGKILRSFVRSNKWTDWPNRVYFEDGKIIYGFEKDVLND